MTSSTMLHNKQASGIPPEFEKYGGMDDLKRKKREAQQLSAIMRGGHALYNHFLTSVAQSSPSQQSFSSELRELVDCVNGYKRYLEEHANTSFENRNKLLPVLSEEENAFIESRYAT